MTDLIKYILMIKKNIHMNNDFLIDFSKDTFEKSVRL